MKLSEILFKEALPLWQEAAEKEFVVEMAKGTLKEKLFRNYMLQDYLYLQDYNGILSEMLLKTEDSGMAAEELRAFIKATMQVVEEETYRVHLPNMRGMGISEGEIEGARRLPAFAEYVAYMRQCLEDEGVLTGLAALLQCSWAYAYIGERVLSQYAAEVARSPYKSWFEAYTGPEYLGANRRWIDFLDAAAEGISGEKVRHLCGVFTACARHENRLWDELYA